MHSFGNVGPHFCMWVFPKNHILHDSRSVCVSLVRAPDGWPSYIRIKLFRRFSNLTSEAKVVGGVACVSGHLVPGYWRCLEDGTAPEEVGHWELGLGFYTPIALPVCSPFLLCQDVRGWGPHPAAPPVPTGLQLQCLLLQGRLCPLGFRPKETCKLLHLGHLDKAERKITNSVLGFYFWIWFSF